MSPIDGVALEHWGDYSSARNEMLKRTDNEITPWHIVRADDKKLARLNLIRHMMSRVDCPEKDIHAAKPDDDIVFSLDKAHLKSGAIAP